MLSKKPAGGIFPDEIKSYLMFNMLLSFCWTSLVIDLFDRVPNTRIHSRAHLQSCATRQLSTPSTPPNYILIVGS